MRVGESCGHQKLKALVVRDCFISKPELTTLVDLFQQDRLERWIQLFSNILYQYPFSKLNSKLQVPEEGRVAHFKNR